MYLSTSENNGSKLLCNLNSQRMNGKFCDVSLTLGKVCLTVHSCVLAACCPTITNWEDISDSSANDPCILRFNDIIDSDNKSVNCAECASKVIEFMYLGYVQFQKDHLKHVEAIGKFLGIPNISVYENPVGLNDTTSNTVSQFNNKNTYNDFVASQSNAAGSVLSSEVKAFNIIYPVPNVTELASCFELDDNMSPSFRTQSASYSEQSPTDPFSCSKCNLKFSDSVQLRQHRETHLGKIYTCYTCKYASQKAFNLIKHLLESNHNEKICSLCMLEADNSEKLKIHLEQHNHPKPFFCVTCNLRFPTRAGLNIHTPKHSSETPFMCSTCNRGFKWKHNLQSHMVVHTTEKKHLCDQCGFSTAHKSTFSAHELTHTGFQFKCPLPGCKFISVLKRNVSNHLATHNKEKMYQCEVCGQSFSQAKNLRRHAIKHDATADFDSCPLCLFKTMRYDKLKEHFKKHHPESDVALLPLKKRKSNATNLPVLNLEPSTCIPVEISIPVPDISTIFVPSNYIILPVLPIIDDTITSTEFSENCEIQYSPIDLTTTEILEPDPDDMC